MAVNTAGIDRALGAIGTTFRLVRLYPPSHPAVQEALRQIASALPALAAMGTLEWKVGATGLHWHGQHLLPRNAQVSELAGLLFARGVRGLQVHPGLTPEHILALFDVATGSVSPDDASLGRIAAVLCRRMGPGPAAAVAPAAPAPPAALAAGPAPFEQTPGTAAAAVPREALPADVLARRALSSLRQATDAGAQRGAVDTLQSLTAALLRAGDTTVVAEVIAGLDEALPRATDDAVVEQLGAVASVLADGPMVQRLVVRLGEPRVPPSERQSLVEAVGALAAVTAGPILDALLSAPPDQREPYRAAFRVAADRAIEPLEGRLDDRREEVVAAVAECLGLTGSPAATPLLVPLTRHRAEVVRERALVALAEIGGRDVSRSAVPALKDESAVVRAAAARTIGVGGDVSAGPLLVRRLGVEEHDGVQAELLRALGRLGGNEALEVLARWAEPGGRPTRRPPLVRAAAVEGLAHLAAGEARALLELYRQDKEPAVKRAAEAGLK